MSGRDAYAEGHLPGAVFADLIQDFSDTRSDLAFTLPSAHVFAAAAGRRCDLSSWPAEATWKPSSTEALLA